jgi:hypothetical protein
VEEQHIEQQPVVQSTEPASAPIAPVAPAPVPSGQTDSAAPTEASVYLTRAEFEELRASLQAEQEKARRERQSERDRQKDIQRRLKDVGEFIKNPDIAAYLGEDAEAVQRKLQADIMANRFASEPEEEAPEQPAPSEQQQFQRAAELATAHGFQQADPEWLLLDPRLYVGGAGSPQHMQALQSAKTVKQQRLSLARPVAPPPAPPPPSTPPPAPPAPPTPTPEPVAMAMGGGGASGYADPLTTYRREFDEAMARGDLAAAQVARDKIWRSGK